MLSNTPRYDETNKNQHFVVSNKFTTQIQELKTRNQELKTRNQQLPKWKKSLISLPFRGCSKNIGIRLRRIACFSAQQPATSNQQPAITP